MRQTTLVAAVLTLLSVPAVAQQPLKLEIKDGRVDLDATAVPARQILGEWAKIGGTKIVGGDKVAGAPLTLKLVNMPERQALDIILRNVAGYMAAPRGASAPPGASAYDRLLILPTSSAAPAATNAARTPAAPGPMAGTERRVAPRPPGMQFPQPGQEAATEEPVQEQEPDQPDSGVTQQPVFTFPQPPLPGNQVFVPVPQGGFGVPGQPGTQQQPLQLQPNPNAPPTIYNFLPTNSATPGPAPTGGFSVIGSPAPGMVQQPAQPQPTPAGQRPKPPGQN